MSAHISVIHLLIYSGIHTMKKSLFWQLFTPVSLIFTVCIIVLALMIPNMVRNNTEQEAIAQAEITVQQFKTLRAYYTKNVIKKIAGTNDISPAIDHQASPDNIPLPATMIHDLSGLLEEQGISIHLYSAFPFPNRENRRMDDFGSEAWRTLSQNPDTVFSRAEEIDGKTMVRVAIADRMVSQACVDCHNSRADTPKNDWQLNDVRGVLEVALPIDQSLANGVTLSNEITGFLLATALLIFASLYFIYKKTIGKKLEQLATALQEIAEGDGDLTRRLDEGRRDELGEVAHWFNLFVGKLQHLMGDIKGSTDSLTGSARQLSQIAEKSNTEITEQQMQTDQLATAINEMAAAVQEVAHNTKQAATTADKANQEASNGRSIVNGNIDAMDNLANEIQKASAVIHQLQSESNEIGGVLDVIKGIAEQTNLLALNAAIEAARAGEQGRGFAVVADEVRTLASRTQESTQEIQNMIERLQSRAQEAVKVMNENQAQSQAGVENASRVNDSLQNINTAIEEISDLNTQIASAADEQSHVAEEVNRNIQQISQCTDAAVGGSEQVARASEDLTRLATQLRDLADRFKT
ncbi:MAG TPA: methyl-accepting chemotaxis protein [Gammaproteobacteria bacterium]|nr:methyl-accepting chemotaxis protein [Gammaproteobacteria bacterium]